MRWKPRVVPAWRPLLLFGAPLVLGAAAVAGLLIAAPLVQPAPSPTPPLGDAEAPPPAPPGVLVHVTGAVLHPGVYRISRGERVQAAITAAGGLAPDADLTRLPNLAALLKDGQQVRVPSKRNSTTVPRSPPVDLNTAPIEDLLTVPGFTPELANAVIEYRTEFGGFQTSRELVDVLGMGEAQYLLARRYLRT